MTVMLCLTGKECKAVLVVSSAGVQQAPSYLSCHAGQGQDQAYQRMGEAAADGGPDVKTEPESSRGEPGPVGPAAATALAAAEQETANGALPTEQPQPPNPSTAAADTAATEAAPEGQVQREAQAASTGGWMEASSNAADAKPGGSPGKFRPFTFKIKL